MPNYDDILKEKQAKPSYHKEFDKDAWIAKQNENRETAYEIIDSALSEINLDDNKMQLYLNKQSQFERYSVKNMLLIMEQHPNAIKVGDRSYWKEQGLYIRKQEKDNPILILEPGSSYLRDDGKIGQYYNAKEVYDVTQTNARLKQPHVTPRDSGLLLQALIYNRPADIVPVDDLGSEAMYNPETNEILVRSGMEANDIFRCVSKELAHAEFAAKDENYNYFDSDFKAECVSYMLCKKNNIDTSSYNIKSLPDTFQAMEAFEVLEELNSIRETASDISSRMSKVFEQNKSSKEKTWER